LSRPSVLRKPKVVSARCQSMSSAELSSTTSLWR
jgi:hypothetical protein